MSLNFPLWKRFLDDNSLWSFVILYLLLHIHFFRKIGKYLEDISRTKSRHEMGKEKCSLHQVDLGQGIVILTCKKWQIQQIVLRISFTENKKKLLGPFDDFKVCYGPSFWLTIIPWGEGKWWWIFATAFTDTEVNNCFSIYHISWKNSTKIYFICDI